MKRITAALVLASLIASTSFISAQPPTEYQPLKAEFFHPVIASIIPSSVPRVIVDTFIKRPVLPKPTFTLPPVKPKTVAVKPKPKPTLVSSSGFRYDPEVSWYGPGFYGKRTACGLAYTTTILGVANKTLPCGTKVTFMWKGKSVTVPVIDRGPYVAGRQWDLSGGLCTYLHHCFTGPIYYRIH